MYLLCIGHRGRQIELEGMYGNKAEMDLMIADTMQARKRYKIKSLF